MDVSGSRGIERSATRAVFEQEAEMIRFFAIYTVPKFGLVSDRRA